MSYNPCSFPRDNRLLREEGCATSVSSLKAGTDTADSDITRPVRPSTMPAGGVLHFLPKGFFPPAHCFFSVEAPARGKRWQFHWQHRTEHVGITAAFQPAQNHHRIQVWGHKFLVPEDAQGMQKDTGMWPILLVQPSVNRSPTFMKCTGISLLTSC